MRQRVYGVRYCCPIRRTVGVIGCVIFTLAFQDRTPYNIILRLKAHKCSPGFELVDPIGKRLWVLVSQKRHVVHDIRFVGNDVQRWIKLGPGVVFRVLE